MRGLVVYYSQTGNTKKVAYSIHKGMSQLMEQCDIAPIKEIDPRVFYQYDLVGLGSPIWGTTPDNVTRFIYSIPHSDGKHIFSFNTHGSLPRWYFPVVIRRLNERGFKVIGYRGWFASVHIQCFPSPYYTDGHPDEIDLNEAEDFGREMVEVSRRITAGGTQLIPPVPDFAPPLPYKLPLGIRSPHGNTKYNKEKCLYPKCHLCMDNCPNNYIDLGASPPKFGDRFTECTSGCSYCELICPTAAIYIDEDDLKWGTELLQTHHDYFEQTLAEEEAAGNFRRLVPLDKIGWDTPYYIVHNKHPRYRID